MRACFVGSIRISSFSLLRIYFALAWTMPRGLSHQLDILHKRLDQIQKDLNSPFAGRGACKFGRLMWRSAKSGEDIRKVMSEVRRIKMKFGRGKPGTASGARAKTQVLEGRRDQTASGQKKRGTLQEQKEIGRFQEGFPRWPAEIRAHSQMDASDPDCQK